MLCLVARMLFLAARRNMLLALAAGPSSSHLTGPWRLQTHLWWAADRQVDKKFSDGGVGMHPE